MTIAQLTEELIKLQQELGWSDPRTLVKRDELGKAIVEQQHQDTIAKY
jgi:hypothetical protein